MQDQRKVLPDGDHPADRAVVDKLAARYVNAVLTTRLEREPPYGSWPSRPINTRRDVPREISRR
jgi:hypothetical protein